MKNKFIKIIIIVLICIGISNISFIKNQERTTANISKYINEEVYDEGEYFDNYYGTYNFKVGSKDYKYKGAMTYGSKWLVPKKLKIIYNKESPSEHRAVIPPLLLSIEVSFTSFVILDIMEKSKKNKNLKKRLKKREKLNVLLFLNNSCSFLVASIF